MHAAHRLAGHFPDGQFFLPLHAHTPGQRPVSPPDALASLLLTAGVAVQQIPPGVAARAGRWRDHVAGKRILLLLDDAAGHEQVRPLLPGTPGSLVLVTSRRRLTALEDSAVISLGTLSEAEAVALLARLAGRADLGPGADPAGEIARLCGYLPLAIGMLAQQLRHHPARTGTEVAAGLAAARDRLAVMRAENLSVAAAFDLSYADLSDAQQRLFRRLGLAPGTDLDAYAGAALDETSPGNARAALDELYDHHLITEPAPGRYQLHDLLREYARALAEADSTGADATGDSRARRPAGELLRPRRRGRQPAHRHLDYRRRAGAADHPAGQRSPAGHARRGRRLARRRAPQPARRRQLRRRPGDAAARDRDRHCDGRFPARPRPLGPGRGAVPDGPRRGPRGRGPARPGRRARRAGPAAAADQ